MSFLHIIFSSCHCCPWSFWFIKIERKMEKEEPTCTLCTECVAFNFVKLSLHLLTGTISYPCYIGQRYVCKAMKMLLSLVSLSATICAWSVEWYFVAGNRMTCRKESCKGACQIYVTGTVSKCLRVFFLSPIRIFTLVHQSTIYIIKTIFFFW